MAELLVYFENDEVVRAEYIDEDTQDENLDPIDRTSAEKGDI